MTWNTHMINQIYTKTCCFLKNNACLLYATKEKQYDIKLQEQK